MNDVLMVGVLSRHSRPDLQIHLQRIEAALCRGPRRDAGQEPRPAFKVGQRLGADVGARLAADYEAGMSSLQLGKRYGLAKSTVLLLLTEAGVKIRRQPGLSDAQVTEAVVLYDQDWSLARIAEWFEVSSSTVRLRLLEAGVQMRDGRRRRAVLVKPGSR